MNGFIVRPSWMLLSTYELICARFPFPSCQHCGSFENLSLDHIIPRSKGGSDDPENFQPLCISCNSRKGAGDDLRWSIGNIYFDETPNLDACREFQRRSYQVILDYQEYFSRPFSTISRSLLGVFGPTGVGKTLVPVIQACAFNRILLERNGRGCPRVDRILILTPQKHLRDQIASETETEFVSFGIFPTAPRVAIVEKYDRLKSGGYLDQFDVFVACRGMFFDGKDEETSSPRRGIETELAQFRLIFIDEPHWGFRNSMQVVEAADQSLVVGLTATPIDSKGRKFVGFCSLLTYTYQDAITFDKSLKYIPSPGTPAWKDCYVDVDIEKADILTKGEKSTVETCQHRDYSLNFVPKMHVARAASEYAVKCDRLNDCGDLDLAPHRDASCKPGLRYPMHVLLKAANIHEAIRLSEELNTYYEANRDFFPAIDGWRSVVHHSDEDVGDVTRLSEKSPWYHYKNHGRLGAEAARVVVLVGMGREGLNYKYCGCVGLCCSIDSLQEHVQRTIGRQIRAVVSPLEDGGLHVPFSMFDTIKVFSHSSFGNSDGVERAAKYLLNMSDHLVGFPDIESLIAGDETHQQAIEIDTTVPLSRNQRLRIVELMGANDGADIDFDRLVDHVAGNCPPRQKHKAREWAESVQERPVKLAKEFKVRPLIDARTFVIREVRLHDPTIGELKDFLIAEDRPAFISKLEDPTVRELVKAWHKAKADQIKQPQFRLREGDKLSVIARALGGRIMSDLKGVQHAIDPGRSVALAYTAMKKAIGTQDALKDDGDHNTVQVINLLRAQVVQDQMLGWMLYELIMAGELPTLAERFQESMRAAEESTNAQK